MSIYKNIVVPVDPSIDSEKIIKRALELQAEGGYIHLVTVVDYPYNFGGAYYPPSMIDVQTIQNQTIDWAKQRLKEIAETHGIDASNNQVFLGSVAKQIKEFASDIVADVIVMGTHARHGLGLLLGSTTNGVLHGAPCDVMAIKIE
ncbi:universal stress protein [Marinicella sp. W31]|uniref:universal stress protein n=1 Tax=Marinicella sp. W31 TaxID=3023713 RepID=UPI0037581A05